MASFDHFPNELLLQVLGYFEGPRKLLARPNLLRACLVSRHIGGAAQYLLYRTISLWSSSHFEPRDQIRGLATTLMERPDLAQEVRSLSVCLLKPRSQGIEQGDPSKALRFVESLSGIDSQWSTKLVSGDEMAWLGIILAHVPKLENLTLLSLDDQPRVLLASMFGLQQQSTKLGTRLSLNSLVRLDIRGCNFERQWFEVANVKELILDGKYNSLSPGDDTSAIPISTLTYHAGKYIFFDCDMGPQLPAFTDLLALCHRLTNLCIKIPPYGTEFGRQRGNISDLFARLQPLTSVLERLEIGVEYWGPLEWSYNATTTTPMCSIAHFRCLKELDIPQEAFANNSPGRARVESLQSTLPQSLEKLTVKFVTIEFLPLLQDLCNQPYSVRNLADVRLKVRDDWIELTSGYNHKNASAMEGPKQRFKLRDLQTWFTLRVTHMKEEYDPNNYPFHTQVRDLDI